MTRRSWLRLRWRRRRSALLPVLACWITFGAGGALAFTGGSDTTYAGTTSLGGTVTLKVSSNGRRIVSSSFRFRPRNCSKGDYLSGTLDTGQGDKISIGSAGRFHRRFRRVPIGSTGKTVGTTTIAIRGRFDASRNAVGGRVAYSKVRFRNGGTCANFSLTYSAQRTE